MFGDATDVGEAAWKHLKETIHDGSLARAANAYQGAHPRRFHHASRTPPIAELGKLRAILPVWGPQECMDEVS
jgi:hypothetical protein